ncbi:MAG: cytochrome b/b6 domain-containing protein [Ignavibacteriaceae bacterium]|jgi:cytochrome b subunit of formate dehydrogenase|nr:cytochrome b/b6 domain-containing protein [Ignavibacteriaceae bacterium]MCW8811960.1 cytochrome b/b6 domain-containing protein [Chlorobium sp.]
MNRTLFDRRIFITITGILLLLASNVFAQSNDDCLMCHDDDTFTTKKNGKEISLYVSGAKFHSSSHSKLQCTSCHIKFDPEAIPHSDDLTPKACGDCHQRQITKHLFHPRLLKATGREKEKDVNCLNCHSNHYPQDPTKQGNKWSAENIASSCGECHTEIKEKYLSSEHYSAFKEGMLGAPNCLNCHKNPIAAVHSTQDTASVKIAQEKLCLSCHLDSPEVRERTTPSAGFITMYEKSVHGSELNSGNGKAANCVNCHGSHAVLKSTDSKSPTFKQNIPTTCGKCHSKIANEYLGSIHGVALKNGVSEAPVCTDCHGEHNILKHNNPQSPVAFQNLSKEVCSPCHSSLKLSEKYGIVSNRFETFNDSYHGLAVEGGSVVVANCASCHGAHNIKPSSDSTSTIYKGNLVKTCGGCHKGANANFAIGKIHVLRQDKSEPVIYIIATMYITLIIVVIGLMFLHNLMDFFRKSKIKKMKQRGLIREERHGHSLYLRMTLNERIQHAALAISFIMLVLTGFMLSFPNSWWVSHIRDLSSDTFEYRSLLHRISAVVMVAVSLYHIYYISFTKRGRQLIKDLLPRYQDIRDAIDVAKFNLGISKLKPKLDRFSYVEKAEYWALIWGTILMTATGILMWFDNTFIGIITKLGWDVARTVHYYEAWLAFLAIVVWHFYFVIFNPDIYPINLAFWKGTISEEEMAEEHPLEYERVKAQQKSEHPESK